MTPIFAYKAGTSGTVVFSSGENVISIWAYSISGGTISINNGDDITIPEATPFSINIPIRLINPTIEFTSTTSYFIQYTS